MIIVIPLFLWPDLKRYGQNIQSHFMQRRIKKVGIAVRSSASLETLTTCYARLQRLGHDTMLFIDLI